MNPRVQVFVQGIAVAAAAAILFWLLREHWGHVFGYLPYLLFLSCPLMHLFMHHGHGHDHHEHMQDRRDQPPAR
jgi:hypothetical protein